MIMSYLYDPRNDPWEIEEELTNQRLLSIPCLVQKYNTEWDIRPTATVDDLSAEEINDCVQDYRSEQEKLHEQESISIWHLAEEKSHSRQEYMEYLSSEYWQQVKHAVFCRDNYMCRRCECQFNLQVHHLWYPARFTELENLSALVLLCNACHRAAHY